MLNEEEVLRVANMVKVAVLAGMREQLRKGKDADVAIKDYENSSFAFKGENLVIVFKTPS